MSRVRVLSLVAALAACAAPVPDAPSDGRPAPSEVWRAAGVASYGYTLEISCFCLHRGLFAVEVREGRVAAVRDAGSGAPAPRDHAERVVTVDGLFALIAEAESRGTPVRAKYHPELGYPVEAEIGLLADDSGTLYLIEDLRPL